MAPAQVIDLPQNNTNYNHKKFQVKRYSHKKFGTRETATKNSIDNNQLAVQIDLSTNCTINTNDTFIKNKPKKDIFRPYALDDSYTNGRKRKHQQMLEEIAPPLNSDIKENKKIVISPNTPSVIIPNPSQQQFPALNYFMYQRLQQNQFNAQTFAIALQKQQAAICLGNMLKRQPNFNMCNLIGESTTK